MIYERQFSNACWQGRDIDRFDNNGTPDTPIAIETKRTGGSPYDVTPDGKRFLVDTQTSDQTSALLNIVENWTAELKK